jgi:hypothetical protein
MSSGSDSFRHRFLIDRAWVERREAALIAEEDALIAAACNRATGDERAFLETVIEERARNRRGIDSKRGGRDSW